MTLRLSPSIANLADLALRVQAAILPRQLDAADAFLARGPVRFSPVTVNRQGLSFAHDVWDWDNIEYAAG